MKRFFTFLLVLFFAAPSARAAQPPAPEQPLTLSDCYKLALKQSERIAIQKELIVEAEAHFTRSFSGILPRVSFESSDKRQDGSGSSAFTLRNVPERRFFFTQPLFSGFKEFAAMKAARAEKRQRTYEVQRAEQLLLIDVADAFYLLLEKREDVATLEMIRGALVDRIDELKDRERVGRARTSEVASAEAQRLQVEAELELIQNDEAIARRLLEFLAGKERIRAIVDPTPELPKFDRRFAFTPTMDRRPDVRAAEEAVEVADRQVWIAKGDYFPKVGIDGNYYVERVGNAKDVSWDATLNISVPIFTGGEIRGAVREANSVARQTELLSRQTRRLAALDITDSFEALKSHTVRAGTLMRAMDAAGESYQLQTEDYRRNLTNNLEVLQALQTFQDTRRNFIRSYYETKRQYWRLQVAIGETL